jgi:hypothetical protein
MDKIFPSNEHQVERIVRVLVGLGLLSLTVMGPHTLWGLVGLVPLATGIVGSCPAYTLLGISTKPRTEGKDAATPAA